MRDLDGMPDHKNTPTKADVVVELVDLKRHDLAPSGGIEFRALSGAEDNGSIEEAEVDREDLWNSQDIYPYPTHFGLSEQSKTLLWGQNLQLAR